MTMRRLSVAGIAVAASLAAGCESAPRVTMPRLTMPTVSMPNPPSLFGLPPQQTGFSGIPFATWQDNEPAYRFYPGDVVDVTFPSAPENNRSVTVAPDGRIALPFIAPIMVADRTVPDVQYFLAQAYRPVLNEPRVEVSVKQASPIKVFVGGEVDKPGVYDMAGDISALQAVIMAGWVKPTAKTNMAVLIRRGFGEPAMMRTVDLRRATFQPGTTDSVAMRRGDILIVPRSGIANWDLFVKQYITDGIPIQFGRSLDGTQFFTTK